MAFFYLYNFGCKVNQAEGEEIAMKLLQQGWKRVFFPSQANLLVVNTCAVTSEAERKARKLIRKLKNENPRAFLVATGCYAELLNSQKKFVLPYDLLIPQEYKHKLPEEINLKFCPSSKTLSLKSQGSYLFSSLEPLGRSRAFIKVQDGCSHFCSYCIVPYIRGKEKSLFLKEVLEKVKKASIRFSEVVLCGVRLGCYGQDLSPPVSLLTLLKEILKKTQIERVRLSSIEPNDLASELVDLVAKEKRVAAHFHLPLQSGDNQILKKMNRPYTADEFVEKAREIKEKIPVVSLTTDVLLGFPGETEEAFQKTVEIVKTVGFSRLHIFKFSPRPGTEAFSYFPRVSRSVIEERFQVMKSLDEDLRSNYARQFVGFELEVLVERKKNGWWEGLSSNYLRVCFPGAFSGNGLIKIHIEKEKEGIVFGKMIKDGEV